MPGQRSRVTIKKNFRNIATALQLKFWRQDSQIIQLELSCSPHHDFTGQVRGHRPHHDFTGQVSGQSPRKIVSCHSPANMPCLAISNLILFNALWNNSFPTHFRHLFIQLKKSVFNFFPDTLEFANAHFNFVFGRSVLTHCHSISCFVTIFINCNSNSSVTVAEHKTAKSFSSIGIHFRQCFTQNNLPYKAHITLDEFEWQNNEFVWKNYNLILAFLTRLAAETISVTIDECECLIFKFDWQKTNMNDN